MFFRLLQVIAVTMYILVAIGVLAYLGLSPIWLVFLLAPAIYFLFSLKPIPPARMPPLPPFVPSSEQQAKIDARLRELESGPPHRNKPRYLDAARVGVLYPDERIDYLELPDKLVLCEHLRPLEAAMRAANVPMDLTAAGHVEVQCIMQEALIRQRIPLADCVRFSSIAGHHDHRVQIASCTFCRQVIEEGICGGPWPAA
jgi:hypothetical protein